MIKFKKIIVGVSGGPDSMYLQNYIINKFGKENIIIAHYNHKFRKESDKEENFLKNFFKEKGVKFISESYKGNNFKEAELRKKRYDFFKKIGWGEYYLALGHNLTDRIETSILNISRGAGIKGFLNMSLHDKKRKIYRPLLNISKKDIEKKCKKLNIPYFIDESNFNENVSKRNYIRKNIISELERFDENFLYKFGKIYDQIEKIIPNYNIKEYLKKIDTNTYLLNYPDNNLEFFVREMLDYFGVNNFRGGVINEIIHYFKYSKGGGFKKYSNLIIKKKNNKIFLSIDNGQK